MQTRFFIALLSTNLLAVVGHGEKHPLPGTLHVFHMESGEQRVGYVIGQKEDGVRIRLAKKPISLRPLITVLLKQSWIQKAVPLEWEVWESALREENQEVLKQGWEAMRGLLGIPGARIGMLGIAWAHTLTKAWKKNGAHSGDSLQTSASLKGCSLQTVGDLYALIEKKSCDPKEQVAARAGRLRIASLQGKNQETLHEAKTWIRQSPDPPQEAWDVWGESLLLEVENFMQAHPRWEQDRFIKPKIIALFHQCLNASLRAFVCSPTRHREAAQGLIRSIRIYQLWGNPGLAQQAISDLKTFYPEFSEQIE